jgi:hypothetical protein
MADVSEHGEQVDFEMDHLEDVEGEEAFRAAELETERQSGRQQQGPGQVRQPYVEQETLAVPAHGRAAADLSAEVLRSVLHQLLMGRDLHTVTLADARQELVAHFMLPVPPGLEQRREELSQLTQEVVAELTRDTPEGAESLGEEDSGKAKSVYLVTLSDPKETHSKDGHPLKPPGQFSREQIRDAVLAVVAKTDANRLSPLHIRLLAIYREKHADGAWHYHVALLAERNFRFVLCKRALLEGYGLASHWSTSHDAYASAVAYGYVPSPKKPQEDLDPTPLLWPSCGCLHSGGQSCACRVHPPLDQASQMPVTFKALAARRERKRLARAEKGKSEARFQDVDLWPVIIRENIIDDPQAPERLMSYAKRCGGLPMVHFCFRNWPRLAELITRSWQVEKVDEYVERVTMSRMTVLRTALTTPCACGGRWIPAASGLFARNKISEEEWRSAMLHSLQHGRSKGSLVCHVGLTGNEGKSFLLAPLELVFGDDGVFTLTTKSAFPLMGLEKKRVVLLDDWRFNEDLIGYPLQLLWFEGKPIIIARPQNQSCGHLKYVKDAPIFITTLEADITSLKGKRIDVGDVAMMVKRLKVFRFSSAIQNPKKVLPCARCFAMFLLGGSAFGGEIPAIKRARVWV